MNTFFATKGNVVLGYVFKRKVFFSKMGMMMGYHPYNLWVGWSGTPRFGEGLKVLAQPS
jgi:hypothetical protein